MRPRKRLNRGNADARPRSGGDLAPTRHFADGITLDSPRPPAMPPSRRKQLLDRQAEWNARRGTTTRRRRGEDAERVAEAIASFEERPLWKRALSFAIWAAVIIVCVIGGRWAYRNWRVGQLAPQLAGIKGAPNDQVIGGLVNLRCGAADEALALYAADSVLRCYSRGRRFFLWTAPPKSDGTQLLMYYRVAPGTEGTLLPWNNVWKGNGVSYRGVEITGLSLESGKLLVRFTLSKDLTATTGLAAGAKYAAEFTLDEFAKLMDDCELDVKKTGLRHPDLGWPANLLARAGALTPEAHDKLRGK